MFYTAQKIPNIDKNFWSVSSITRHYWWEIYCTCTNPICQIVWVPNPVFGFTFSTTKRNKS